MKLPCIWRSSCGLFGFSLQLAQYMKLKSNHTILFFLIETSYNEYGHRYYITVSEGTNNVLHSYMKVTIAIVP